MVRFQFLKFVKPKKYIADMLNRLYNTSFRLLERDQNMYISLMKGHFYICFVSLIRSWWQSSRFKACCQKSNGAALNHHFIGPSTQRTWTLSFSTPQGCCLSNINCNGQKKMSSPCLKPQHFIATLAPGCTRHETLCPTKLSSFPAAAVPRSCSTQH